MNADSKRRMRDIIFVLILLLLSLACLLLFSRREPGECVRVEVDGRDMGVYPLSVDGTFPLNGGTNILVIENGEAYLSDADCPDKLCVRQGHIHRRGETITCLPNRLTVTVEKKATGDDVEIIL